MPATTRFLFSILLLGFLSFTPEFQATAADNTVIKRSYSWEYYGKEYTMDYTFRSADYHFYKNIHRTYDDFTVYLDESSAHAVIQQFTTALQQIAESHNFSEWQTVEFVAAFVQNLVYIDDGKYEYPRYPEETLVDMGGDCEDTAILLEAILRSMGYESVLLSPKGHMGVGIALDKPVSGVSFNYRGERYYYIETTNTGWGIGQYPDELSADVVVYDPGMPADAKLLAVNGDNSRYKHTKPTEPVQTGSGYADNNSKYSDDNTNKVTKDEQFDPDNFHFESNETEKKDQIVVNGRRQTVVTHTTSVK